MSDEKEGEEIYCDWCGEFPIYISFYEDDDCSEEVAICKKCYQSMEDE